MTPSRSARLLVLALTALVAETLRVSFPLLYTFAEQIGFLAAAGVVPLLFAATALLAPVGRLAGIRGTLALCAAGAAAARLVMQAQGTPGLVPTLVAVLLGMTALALALRVATARAGTGRAAAALFTGLALDTTVRLVLVTWDAAWQPGRTGWLVAVVQAALVLGGLALTLRERTVLGADRLRTGLVPGPLLALATLGLANPPFTASSAGVGLAVAGAVVLAGLAAAVLASGLAARTWVCRVAGVALPVALVLLTGPWAVSGPLVLVLVPAATAAVGVLLVRALGHADEGPSRLAAWRTTLGAAAGSVSLVLVLMPYQISYDLDLLRDVPAQTWPAAGGMALSAAALLHRRAGDASASGRHTEPGELAPRDVAARGAAVVLALLVVPGWLAATGGRPEAPTGVPEVRVMTFNIHSAVDWHGRLDPEQVARVVEEQGADVVLLQEVSRGWPIGGGLDSVSWLARRLGMDYVYGPAADHQFGNAVLADRPLEASWSGRLDRGEGPMHRGYVGAAVPVGDTTLHVWSTHLQHRDDTTATRRAQARAVLAAWDGQPRTVLGGDLNSRPGSPDVEPWFDGTGLVSAQDEAGDPAWNTSPSLDPDHRIDWLLATPDLGLRDAAVPPTLASDHLPVVVTVVVE